MPRRARGLPSPAAARRRATSKGYARDEARSEHDRDRPHAHRRRQVPPLRLEERVARARVAGSLRRPREGPQTDLVPVEALVLLGDVRGKRAVCLGRVCKERAGADAPLDEEAARPLQEGDRDCSVPERRVAPRAPRAPERPRPHARVDVGSVHLEKRVAGGCVASATEEAIATRVLCTCYS